MIRVAAALLSPAVALLFPAAALATDADPGLLYPGASPMAADSGELGLSTGLGQPGWDDAWHLGVHFQGGYAPTDRVAITAQGLTGEGGGGMLALGARYRVPLGESFGLAPFAMLTSTGPAEVPVLLPGVALEGGWEHVRLDAALPVVVVGIEGVWGPRVLLLSEAGVSFVVGQHSVRLGSTTALSPTVTYRWAGEALYVEASYADLSYVSSGPRFFTVGGGWRF